MPLARPLHPRVRERRCGVLFVIALWLCATRPAFADDTPTRRVLLIEAGRDPLLERVGAEIAGLGFSLVRSDAKAPLEIAARAEQAVVAIRVLPSRKGIEVWMADATSGRSLLRQMVVDESPSGPDRELIALQTAELLRTSLLGEQQARQRSDAAPGTHTLGPVPDLAPAQLAAAASDNASNDTGVQLGCGVLYSPGGVTAAVQLGFSLQRFLSERWGVALDLSIPLRSGTLTGVEGSTKLGGYFAGAALLARFARRASPFFATLGAGPALMLITYDGQTRAPLHASSGSRVTGAAYLRGDIGVETAHWLRLGLRVLVGASLQRTSLTFAGNAAGNFGPAFFAGLVLAELSLP
jgi:hypothetical protein